MNHPRVVAIVQARMQSTRLPGKVLEPIQGTPMLVWVVDRAHLATMLDDLVVATTTDPSDDPVVLLCEQRGVKVFRGDPVDVLDRYWKAAELFEADVIVRLTADCPLIDPALVDESVNVLLDTEASPGFVATRLPWKRTYPIGLDVEACTREVLAAAWRESKEPHQREHVMPFIYENPDRFKVVLLNADQDYGNLRWTVDTKEDLEFIRAVTEKLPDRKSFGWRDVLALVSANPELKEINAGVEHKSHRDVG